MEKTELLISPNTFQIVSNRGRLSSVKDAYECKLILQLLELGNLDVIYPLTK